MSASNGTATQLPKTLWKQIDRNRKYTEQSRTEYLQRIVHEDTRELLQADEFLEPKSTFNGRGISIIKQGQANHLDTSN